MKYVTLLYLLVFIQFLSEARGKFSIKGKESPSVASMSMNQQGSTINQISGNFRLKEITTSSQKVFESDLVTYFISKNHESEITFHINCAKKIDLYYVFSDNNRRKITVRESSEYQRLVKNIDLSKFKNGPCRIAVLNAKDELISTIEFEKTDS